MTGPDALCGRSECSAEDGDQVRAWVQGGRNVTITVSERLGVLLLWWKEVGRFKKELNSSTMRAWGLIGSKGKCPR